MKIINAWNSNIHCAVTREVHSNDQSRSLTKDKVTLPHIFPISNLIKTKIKSFTSLGYQQQIYSRTSKRKMFSRWTSLVKTTQPRSKLWSHRLLLTASKSGEEVGFPSNRRMMNIELSGNARSRARGPGKALAST